MNVATFIRNYKEAFGEEAPLPIAFSYSDTPAAVTEKINGCFFKGLHTVRDGQPVSLNAETIGCGGGKFYTGFSEMPAHVPEFVSAKERYKQTPEMVLDFIRQTEVRQTDKKYLNFIRIDRMASTAWRDCCSSPRPICSRAYAHGLSTTTTGPMP